MKFLDHQSLMKQIEADLFPVIESIGEEVNFLVKFTVEEIVYDPYRPRTYVRQRENGGFLSSWISEMGYNLAGAPMATIYSDGQSMVFDQENLPYVHGAPAGQNGLFGPETDRRDVLDALIAEGIGYDFFMASPNNPSGASYMGPDDNWWTRPRDYFSHSKDLLEHGGKLSEYAIRAFKKNGFKLKR